MLRIMIVLLLLALPANAAEVEILPQPDGSVLILLPAEHVARCQAEGGCRIVTAQELEQFLINMKPHLCNEKST